MGGGGGGDQGKHLAYFANRNHVNSVCKTKTWVPSTANLSLP